MQHNIHVNTCDKELYRLEEYLNSIVRIDSDSSHRKELSTILSQLVKYGCCYRTWEAATILAKAVATSYNYPNNQMLQEVHQNFYQHCGLDQIDPDEIVSGIDKYESARIAKTAYKKHLKELEEKNNRRQKSRKDHFAFLSDDSIMDDLW